MVEQLLRSIRPIRIVPNKLSTECEDRSENKLDLRKQLSAKMEASAATAASSLVSRTLGAARTLVEAMRAATRTRKLVFILREGWLLY